MLDPQGAINLLPDYLKVGASAGLFIICCAVAFLGVLKGLRKGEDPEHHEAEPRRVLESLGAGPVRDALTALETTAENAQLQTEALKVIAAALTAMAKCVEEDFDERRVNREVERRLREERERRESARAAA